MATPGASGCTTVQRRCRRPSPPPTSTPPAGRRCRGMAEGGHGACMSWAEEQGLRWCGRSLQSMPGRRVAWGAASRLPIPAAQRKPWPCRHHAPPQIRVPANWECQGHGRPHYTNFAYPFPGGFRRVYGRRLLWWAARPRLCRRLCCLTGLAAAATAGAAPAAPQSTAAATSDPCRLHALHPCHPHAVNPPFVPEDNPTGCYQLAFDAPAEAAGQRCGSGGCWSAPRLYAPARGAATLPPLGQRRAAAAACLPQACPPSSVSPLHLGAHTPAARSAALMFEGVDSAFYCWLNGQVRGRFCCGCYLRRAEPAGWGPGGPMRAPHLQALEPACPAGDCS